MAGWSATEMPRQGVRPCGLAPWEKNATVAIYCGNQVRPCCSPLYLWQSSQTLLFPDNWFMDRMLRHGDAMRKTAILRLGAGEYEKIDEHGWSNLDMEIHEHLQVEGEVGVIKARLEHHDKRSLESYYKKHEEYANWEANRYKALKGDFTKLTKRQKTKYRVIANRWFGFAYFCVCYFVKRGFLDGRAGYVFARGKWKYFDNIRRKLSSMKD